ncbi:MAG: N-acetyltransferase family protein [Acidobacteriota bacterium]
MSEAVTIRKAVAEDMPQIKWVFQEFARFHEMRDSSFTHVDECADIWGNFVEGHLSSDDALVVVAEVDGQIAGYCVAMIQTKPPVYRDTIHGYVDNLGVLEEYQRKGIGESLYKRVKEWFDKRGIRRIELFAATANERSTAFWRKMGFQPFMENMFSES